MLERWRSPISINWPLVGRVTTGGRRLYFYESLSDRLEFGILAGYVKGCDFLTAHEVFYVALVLVADVFDQVTRGI
jgi:hypothetical protein